MENKKEKKILSLKNLFNTENDEIKKLKDIKKKIKKTKTIEELDDLEEDLIEIGVIEEGELEKIKEAKKKKKKKMTQREMFEERIRCNLEIINRTIMVGKQFKKQQRIRQEEEKLQNRDERDSSRNGVKVKEKNDRIR